MATPIRPTPIIKGKDAEKILHELKPVKWTPALKRRAKELINNYETISSKIKG
ncbi:MAG: hypothetical protein QME81_20615 [bacterium]|nr:hypothetical protein [bacterium]